MEPKVIVITGPTCSGKTKLGLILARKLNSEIISADSRQIYKYLDIGTAKPSDAELQQIFHYFISILKPDELYSSSRFENEALDVIFKMTEENKTPIVVGGSGLYIKALVDGIFDAAGSDENYREHLHCLKRDFGNEYLYDELKIVDPESASVMLPQNWKRVMRALEVFHLTGEKIGELQKGYKRNIKFKFVQYGLSLERSELYRNIENRVDRMISGGLMEETINILNMGYSKDLNSLNAVGYKEIISNLDGRISLERAIELIKRNTRRFAKRQLTWFRADERISWFELKSSCSLVEQEKEFEEIAEEIIRREGLYEG